MANKHEAWELKQMQSLPLDIKIRMTKYRIREWINEFGEDGVYVSFSGGKDSTVLLDIVRKDYPSVEAVFVNTGLEYPSVRTFAESKENVIVLRPEKNFREVICEYGYPVIGKEVSQTIYEARKAIKKGNDKYTYRLKKLNGEATDKEGNPSCYNIPQWKYLIDAPFNISHMCCDVMKKKPAKRYEKEHEKTAIIASMAEESFLRKQKWLENGCNAFEQKRPQSKPMSFWVENDVLTYLHKNNISIADAYGQIIVKGTEDGQVDIADILKDYRDRQFVTTGCKRTGCIFCGFGITQDKDRFIRLSEQEPTLCDYVIRGGEFDKTDGMWKPTKDGLGYWFVLEWLNVHGGLNIGVPDRERYIKEFQSAETRKHLEAV